MYVKSCPVCGHPPVLSEVHDEVVINCTHCDYEYRLELLVPDDEDFDFFYYSRNVTDAVRRWNQGVVYYVEHHECELA